MGSAAPSRRVRWSLVVLSTLAVLNAVGALAGAFGLAFGFLDLGATLNDRLPGGSPVLAGVALAVLVALPNAVLAVLAVRHNQHTGAVGLLVGVGMVMWILVQLVFIRQLSFFHPLYAAVGLVMICAGALAMRVDRLRERAERFARTTPSSVGGAG